MPRVFLVRRFSLAEANEPKNEMKDELDLEKGELLGTEDTGLDPSDTESDSLMGHMTDDLDLNVGQLFDKPRGQRPQRLKGGKMGRAAAATRNTSTKVLKCSDEMPLDHHLSGNETDLRTCAKLKCEECGKAFKTKYTLRIHRRMPSHTSIKPFVCPTCGKGFRLSSTLCRHKIIHTSQRPHECQLCRKSFNRSSTLKTHMRTHGAQKEFQCPVCSKGFHQKGNLRNHTLIHTGEKPYSCTVCYRNFNKLSNLKFHMHSHTDHKPYRCRHCKLPFSRRGELKHHIETQHAAPH